MLSQEESQSVAEELSNRIRAYKRKRPNLSSQNIAKRFGMSASTFNRIENLDIKTPTFEQIVRVLSGTGHDEDLVRFVENKFPHLNRLIQRKTLDTNNLVEFDANLKDCILSNRYNKIFILILCRKHTDKDFIKNQFGLEGLEIIKELKSKNILNENEHGQYFISNNTLYFKDYKDSRDLLLEVIKQSYDFTGANNKESINHLSMQLFACDKEKVMPWIQERLEELYNDFFRFANEPENKGDDVIYLALSSDTLFPNQINQLKNNEGA